MSKVQQIRQMTAAEAEEQKRRRRLYDECGELERELALVAPKQERFSIVKAEIQEIFKDAPADMPVADNGDHYQAQATARRQVRTITDKKKAFNALKKSLGIDGVIALLDIPMGTIDKNVPESVQKTFIHQERSGYRTIEMVALHPVAGGGIGEAA